MKETKLYSRSKEGSPLLETIHLKANTTAIQQEWAKPGVVGKPFGLGRTTVFRLLSEGKIKSAKIGKIRLVSVDSLREYIESRAQAPTSKEQEA